MMTKKDESLMPNSINPKSKKIVTLIRLKYVQIDSALKQTETFFTQM